jgi:hypothetical protein
MANWKAGAREIRHVLAEAGRSYQPTIKMDSSIKDITSCSTYKHCDHTINKTRKVEDAISLVLM